MSRAFLPALGLLASATAMPAAAAMSPAEQLMVHTIDSEQQRTVDMLRRWVEQNSGTMNIRGVEAVAHMIEPEFQQLGFRSQWISMLSVSRAGHLVARHVGSRHGKRLLLIGHLDTVFEPDSPFQQWIMDGQRARGPGAGDDKGGDAVIITALRAMKAAGTLSKANVTVFLTGDEEDAGRPLSISRRDLIAEGKKADVALDFEDLAVTAGPTGPHDMGSTGRRSAGSWTVTVTGRSAHSAGVGAGNYGAIYELARIIDQFRRELPEDKLTYNVGLIGGGQTVTVDADKIRLKATGKTNIIAATAIARGDLRAISQDQIDRAEGKMRAVIARPLEGAHAEISFDPDIYPPMTPTEGNRALLRQLNGVNRDIGLPEMGELDPSQRGAGDISFVAADVNGLAGLGPSSSGSHTSSEAVDIPSIFKQAKRAAILMSRLAAARR